MLAELGCIFVPFVSERACVVSVTFFKCSASFKAFDRLALLGDWQAFHQPPWASLSTTGGRGGGSELIAVIFQSTRGIQSMKSIIDDNRYQSISIDIN